jgi:hypothetical protein
MLPSPQDMLSNPLEMVVCYHRGPILGDMGGMLRYWDLWEKGEISFVSGELLRGIRETCKRRLWKWTTLSIGAPTGEPGGVLFTGPFERQMKEGSGYRTSLINFIWTPFRIQIMLWSWVWGQSWTSVKDQGSHDLASEYVAQGPVLRPMCIGPERAGAQLLHYTPSPLSSTYVT